MYNFTQETTLLLNRVGWQGYSLPEVFTFVLDAANKKSDSGLFFDYVGSLATTRNVCELAN